MIKRNDDNVFAIASSSNHSPAKGATVSLCPGAVTSSLGTRIPQPRAVAAATAKMTPPAENNTKEANIALSGYVEKWKIKYEEAERKHKASLLKNEKARREHADVQRQLNIVSEERNHLDSELRERERELNKLRQVSEKLFHEYQQLKNQHEIDSGVMQKVMKQAGEWYKQNRQLKRRSAALIQALPDKNIELDLTDSIDNVAELSHNEEAEFLRRTVSELSRKNARLLTDLETAQLQEFEAQQALVNATQELESVRELCAAQSSELLELRSQLDKHHRLSKVLIDEVKQLKENADQDRQMAETYKQEAREAQSRALSLSRRSAVLQPDAAGGEGVGGVGGVGGVEGVEGEGALQLALEVESLRRALVQQADRADKQREEMLLKLAEKNEETDILIWEEKIKLAEEDARKAIERAERAERRIAEMERSRGAPRRGSLMSKISYFENGGNNDATLKTEEKVEEVPPTPIIKEVQNVPAPAVAAVAASPPPPPPPPRPAPVPAACAPPPPPPPPPPPAPLPLAAAVSPPSSLDSMAQLLSNRQGSLRKTIQNGAECGGAIDAIVDQIKGGKFHLKSTDQNFLERKPKDDPPEAVKEMLSILGTLRKRRAVNRKPSFVTSNNGDVANT